MLEPCLLCGAHYNIYHQCSLIFRQASPEPLRGKVAISFNLLQSVSYNFLLSAARFSDELGMQIGAHPYTSFTYSSVRPDLLTGLFPEP